jgi:serine/threonine protein kinase
VLGAGGFGITYKAFDEKSRKLCAIKEFVPNNIVYRTDDGLSIMPVSDDKNQIFVHGMERFMEEAEILEKLNVLDSVVNVYDFFFENRTCYFVMEYLDGVTLFQLTKVAGGRLPLKITLEVIKSIGLALIGVHSFNIFHRDISPDNIFLTYDGAIKLIDFGNAKNLIRNDKERLSVVLKPGFAPLEQFSENGKQGTYTDVFSLAATMYHMLTGQKLPDVMEMNAYGYVKLEQYGIDKYISDAVDAALEMNYKQRTQTIIKFLTDLRLVNSQDILDIQEKLSINLDKAETKEKKPYLEIYIDNYFNGHYNIPLNEDIIIGRSAQQSNLILTQHYISKKHCNIYFDRNTDNFYITDFSTNGVYVDGVRLPYNVSTSVKSGCVLAIGCYECTVKVGVDNE